MDPLGAYGDGGLGAHLQWDFSSVGVCLGFGPGIAPGALADC